jgi:hypothetical protein
MPEPELEDLHSTKRRGLVGRQADSPIRNPVPTPKPTPCGDVIYSRASTERSFKSMDSDGKRDGAGTPRSSPSDFHTEDDGSHSAHIREASQGLLLSSIRSVSPIEGIAGERYIESTGKAAVEDSRKATTKFIGMSCCLGLRRKPLDVLNAAIVHSRRTGTVHHELLLGGRAQREHCDNQSHPSHIRFIGPQ